MLDPATEAQAVDALVTVLCLSQGDFIPGILEAAVKAVTDLLPAPQEVTVEEIAQYLGESNIIMENSVAIEVAQYLKDTFGGRIL